MERLTNGHRGCWLPADEYGGNQQTQPERVEDEPDKASDHEYGVQIWNVHPLVDEPGQRDRAEEDIAELGHEQDAKAERREEGRHAQSLPQHQGDDQGGEQAGAQQQAGYGRDQGTGYIFDHPSNVPEYHELVTIAYTALVPATSANLGPGFDSLGLALGLYDEVTAAVIDGPTKVEVAGEGAGELLTDDRHLVVQAMRQTFDEIDGKQPTGIRLRCVNNIPQARGLGSSSAAIVAGVALANALAGQPLGKEDELRIAGRIEGHPDNVAPCLLGGFTIAWTFGGTAGGTAKAVSMAPHPGVELAVLVPANRGFTAEARASLPETVPHEDAAFNASRSALLVHAMTRDPSLLFEATQDRLHQDYRAAAMPASAELVGVLRDARVAAVISGAGPSVLALTPLPGGFDPGPPWLTHMLTVEIGGRRVRSGNISSTFGHADMG